MDWCDVLRQAIKDHPEPAYKIAAAAGVAQATVSEFMAGASLKADNFQKLAQQLGFELVKKKGRKSGTIPPDHPPQE